MARVLLIGAIVLLTIYCVVEVAQTDRYAVRHAPKWLWVFAVICVPILGPLAWLLFGRPQPGRRRPDRLNPDDDPDFLRGLG